MELLQKFTKEAKNFFTRIDYSMNIQPINIYSNNYTQKKRLTTELTFGHGGKPLALDKIVKQRSYLIPERVLARAKEALAKYSRFKPVCFFKTR